MTYRLVVTDRDYLEQGQNWLTRQVHALMKASGMHNNRAGRIESWRDPMRAAQVYEVSFDARAWTG